MKPYMIVFLLIISNQVAALTCPTIKQIKENRFGKFSAYHLETNIPLTKEQQKEFIQLAETFALASFIPQDRLMKSKVKCLYHDKNGASLYTYLAQENVKLADTENYWYSVTGENQCAAGIKRCQFDTSTPSFLANR